MANNLEPSINWIDGLKIPEHYKKAFKHFEKGKMANNYFKNIGIAIPTATTSVAYAFVVEKFGNPIEYKDEQVLTQRNMLKEAGCDEAAIKFLTTEMRADESSTEV